MRPPVLAPRPAHSHCHISLSQSGPILVVRAAVTRETTEGFVPDDAFKKRKKKRKHVSLPFVVVVVVDELTPPPAGSKKDRHGGDVLTLMLRALQSIVVSDALPADKVLVRPPTSGLQEQDSR